MTPPAPAPAVRLPDAHTPGALSAEAAACARLTAFFEGLTPPDLDRLDSVYTPDVRFKDPFNDVRGIPAARAIFAHMFTALVGARFEVHDALVGPGCCTLTWTMHFTTPGAPGRPQTIRGASLLRLAADGRVHEHRDYWDAAEELYEKQPVLGALMRWLRRKLATPLPA